MSEEAIPMIVLIPTRARAAALEATLSSLASADRPAGFKYVMVVENGSAGGKAVVEKMVSRIPVRYLYTPDPGKSHALNLGLEEVDEELLVFFDDDVAVGKETLLGYEAGAGEWGRGHFFGGVQRARWVGDPDLRYRDYFPRCMIEVTSARGGLVEDDSELFPFLGFNWAAWAGDVRRVGGFDVRFGPGSTTDATGQETEAQRRLTRAGCRPILLTDCRVEHVIESERASGRWLRRRRVRSGIEASLLALDAGGRAWRGLAAGQLIRSVQLLGRALLRPWDGMRRFVLVSRLHYLAGIVRGRLIPARKKA